MKKFIKLETVIVKHKVPIIHAHNALHTVYWAQATVFAPSLAAATLYGSLAVLTVAISYCAACKGAGHE